MVTLATIVYFETNGLYWRLIYIYFIVLLITHIFSSYWLSKNTKIEIYRTIILPVVLHRHELGLSWMHSLSLLISWSLVQYHIHDYSSRYVRHMQSESYKFKYISNVLCIVCSNLTPWALYMLIYTYIHTYIYIPLFTNSLLVEYCPLVKHKIVCMGLNCHLHSCISEYICFYVTCIIIF